MTVKELIKELKGYPGDALVYTVNDWEAVDESGILTDLHELGSVCHQVVVEDMGMDFIDITQVLIE